MSTPTFSRISIEQFDSLLRRFPFTRKINAVHMHHTWRPRRADFRGHATILGMWRHHTQTNCWSDIAQHITIDPEGMIWLGRNWNLPPASANGHNGNASFGPFMFEMIGDFDQGRDPFDGKQKETTLQVIARVQTHFNLPLSSLRFHNSMSPKSCPGGAIDHARTIAEVKAMREMLAQPTPRGSADGEPFPQEADLAIADAIRELSRNTSTNDPAEAELSHDEHEADDVAAPAVTRSGRDAASRGSGLDTAALAALRPHLVNLRMGRLSGDGEASSTEEDIDVIFDEHLKRALDESPPGEKLRLMFFAHGGLVSESSGLQIAHKHVRWWRDNGVYPIYFIWETGLFETIGQLLNRARQGSRALTRDLADFTTDPLIETAVRVLQAPRIWGGMKASAEHAADAPAGGDPGGGAHYVASRLQAFCEANGERIELHAVGHSAGSIFHAWFVPLVRMRGGPAFKTLHLMAPAIRVDTFKQRMLQAIGNGGAAQSLTLYTMRRDYERDDHCARIYRKSLLYLIYYALEDQRKTPILGLEESLRGDPELKELFGLAGRDAGGAAGEIIWSPSMGDSGRSASRALSHGGFDDDAPTMNSIARRILGKADAQAIVDYPVARSAGREWIDEVDWPSGFGAGAAPLPLGWMPQAGPSGPAASCTGAVTAPAPAPKLPGPQAGGGGRRVALCVGIDAYPAAEHQLAGCVNDATTWARTLAGLGFETRLLLDSEASRAALERELGRLVGESRPGDVIVFQYAGHGTHVVDIDGDEDDDRDEALCPVDFASGALYIDDDIADVLRRLPEGVNLTCFMDCCHSGTNTRFAVGLSPLEASRPPGTRARYVRPTAPLEEAHKRFRAQRGASRSAAGAREGMRDIKFSACLDHEVALEFNGSGDFTRRAMKVLAGGVGRLTNEEFLRRVLVEFGSAPRQRPMLDCDPEVREALLLQPIGVAGRDAAVAGASAAGAEAPLLQAVQLLSQAVQALGAR